MVLTIPGLISTFSEGRSIRFSGLSFLASVGLVAYAYTQKPGGYQIDEIPDVIVRVIGQLI
ncbi:50S ribosomal protein L35 [Rhodobacteraceae bacterium HTCC2150]|nr:50S ribosomal protein L35 [Rhodobacteraceae bacterium HTCC2150]